ncbi:MAG: YbcC family protein, partial [Geminicoccaceae bacterium]
PDLAVDLMLQHAYEAAYQRRLVQQLAANKAAKRPEQSGARKPLQAAFCIDVRSEIYRRALESVCPEAETIGFAGFFGFPIEYVPIGRIRGGAQCPVLLNPAFTVCEAVDRASSEEELEILGLRLLRRRAAKAWKSFKLSAVSSFTYVETMGLTFAAKILSDSLGLTRPVQDPNVDGLDRRVIERIGPRLEPREVDGRATGFDAGQRVAMAEAVLRAMSMTGNFARLVMLTGHGSTTVNNPHASGLDCGACGGHTGEANARVAAGILNDPGVRRGLAENGIAIPADTWFLGCLHDTTTDEIRIYDPDEVPASHAADLEQLRTWLAKASSLARLERASLLGVKPGQGVDRQVLARSRDWSQVRPEWGLAGNAAFIAAPRERTLDLDLGGRAFLHSYDWSKDQDFGVLQLIMTAPMVVASWINLQYYGSTVNNHVFGSGNKVLHNVVGQLGVLEGNAGDLKVGLPWQSVHDGRRFVHEPVRLNVFIEAPQDAIDAVIERHGQIRDLVDNGWVHLFRIDAAERRIARYLGGLRWRTEAAI